MTKTTMILGAAMAMALGACGSELDQQPDFDSIRASGGKADGWWVDKNLSCQGSCGSIANGFVGYCGCDDKCATYGDCCNDKRSFGETWLNLFSHEMFLLSTGNCVFHSTS